MTYDSAASIVAPSSCVEATVLSCSDRMSLIVTTTLAIDRVDSALHSRSLQADYGEIIVSFPSPVPVCSIVPAETLPGSGKIHAKNVQPTGIPAGWVSSQIEACYSARSRGRGYVPHGCGYTLPRNAARAHNLQRFRYLRCILSTQYDEATPAGGAHSALRPLLCLLQLAKSGALASRLARTCACGRVSYGSRLVNAAVSGLHEKGRLPPHIPLSSMRHQPIGEP